MTNRKDKGKIEKSTSGGPKWDELFELATAQAGCFTLAQAVRLGMSSQLLYEHVQAGNLERRTWGVFRFARFPPSEHEDLVEAWLWSRQEGVISHETALQLHRLSDAFPARIHMTLPSHLKAKRRKTPDHLYLHYADLDEADNTWIGPVPVTTPGRTVNDVAAAHGDAIIVEQAVEQGLRAGMFRAVQVVEAIVYAASFNVAGATRVFPETVEGMGDSFVATPLSGTPVRPLAADWPTLVEAIVRRHGGRIYAQWRSDHDASVWILLAWPPHASTTPDIPSLRQELSKVLSWQ